MLNPDKVCPNGQLTCDEARCECAEGTIRVSLMNNTCIAPSDCECEEGFERFGDICVDTNECEEEDICGPNTECWNNEGSYQCYCLDGYYPIANPIELKLGDIKEPNQICVDINECQSDKHGCKGTCNNTVGSYECGCEEGFEMNDKGDCEDIDECATKSDDCTANQVCINTKGSHMCHCVAGYIKE